MYIFFETNLIKDLGYDTNLSEHSNNINVNKEFLKIKIDGLVNNEIQKRLKP